jgi:hypothetical protein
MIRLERLDGQASQPASSASGTPKRGGISGESDGHRAVLAAERAMRRFMNRTSNDADSRG